MHEVTAGSGDLGLPKEEIILPQYATLIRPETMRHRFTRWRRAAEVAAALTSQHLPNIFRVRHHLEVLEARANVPPDFFENLILQGCGLADESDLLGALHRFNGIDNVVRIDEFDIRD